MASNVALMGVAGRDCYTAVNCRDHLFDGG
jgi:hypothetical protein